MRLEHDIPSYREILDMELQRMRTLRDNQVAEWRNQAENNPED